MKKLILGFILLICAVAIGYFITQDPGYVMIYYNQWSITSSMWVSLLALIIALIILSILFRLLDSLFSLKKIFSSWSKKRRHKKSLSQSEQALCLQMMGDWKKAGKLWEVAHRNGASSLLYHYFQSILAQQQNDTTTRDQHITQAMDLSSSQPCSLLMHQARLCLDNDDAHEALFLLEKAHQLDPKNKIVLLQYKTVLEQQELWPTLKTLLPILSKQLNKQSIESLTIKIHAHELCQCHDYDSLTQLWVTFPSRQTSHPDLFYAYCQVAIQLSNNHQLAERVELFLKKTWDPRFIAIYAKCHHDDPTHALLTAEQWLEKHANDYDLLLGLSQLAIHNKLWAKAMDYLKACESLKPSNALFVQLAKLSDIMGDREQSLTYYRKIEYNQ